MNPSNYDEWIQWASQLDEENAVGKLNAMNTFQFIDMLSEEGYTSKQVEDIFLAVVGRVQELGLALPTEGEYLNPSALAQQEALLAL